MQRGNNTERKPKGRTQRRRKTNSVARKKEGRKAEAVRIRWTIILKDRAKTVVVELGDAVLQARYRRILSAQVWPTRLA